MSAIPAIFENGVFRPLNPLQLPERSLVELEVRRVTAHDPAKSADDVYAILNRRFNSGEPEVAASHNEHQP